MASARSHGSQPPRPPAASHPPTGATAIARPRKACVDQVKRLASEYQKTMASATGDSAKHSGPSSQARPDEHRRRTRRRRRTASRRLMRPAGSSRAAVRGFRRVEARIDEPVESHRRAPRADHRDHDPGDPLPASAARASTPAAPRSARTAARTPNGRCGRTTRRCAGVSTSGFWSIARTFPGSMPDTRYCSTSVVPGGTATAIRAARRPRCDGPVRRRRSPGPRRPPAWRSSGGRPA